MKKSKNLRPITDYYQCYYLDEKWPILRYDDPAVREKIVKQRKKRG